jgi:transposase-like protein
MSTVTDAVMAEVTEWQNRPLEPMAPVVFFDALRVKIRWKDRMTMAVALRAVYTAVSADAARAALEALAAGPWGQRCPNIAKMWRAAWPHVNPFFAFPRRSGG